MEVYGASETAGIGWRDDPDEPFALLDHWRPGIDTETLLRVLPDGTCEAARIPDRLAWCGPRAFRVEGRRDEAVQVGGVNVFPSLVRDQLLKHPCVHDAAVRLMSPGEGVRLKAFIALTRPSRDVADLRRELIAWCNERLTVPERPKAFSFGSELPRNALLKLADWPIFEAATRSFASMSAMSAPNGPMDQTLDFGGEATPAGIHAVAVEGLAAVIGGAAPSRMEHSSPTLARYVAEKSAARLW